MSFTMKTLTEGIRQRHMGAQHQRLTEKWNRTGLLRGLNGYNRENMAVMLENQAAQLLRESNTLGGAYGAASGDIRGFQNVAFPIVRRVFGGLVANELVSIQPMSLPSGLLFYLDYTYGNDVGGDADEQTYASGQSIYNSPTGKGIQSGSIGVGGQYDLLGSGYSRRHLQTGLMDLAANDVGTSAATQITLNPSTSVAAVAVSASTSNVPGNNLVHTALTGAIGRLVDFDSDLAAAIDSGVCAGIKLLVVPCVHDVSGYNPAGSSVTLKSIWGENLVDAETRDNLSTSSDQAFQPDLTMLQDMTVFGQTGTNTSVGAFASVPASIQASPSLNFRKFTKRVSFDTNSKMTVDPLGGTHILFVMNAATASGTFTLAGNDNHVKFSFIASDSLDIGTSTGDALTIPSFEAQTYDAQGVAAAPVIPEIDIKIESLAVTAVSRKLKAKWSPELAQDLNAYHSLDAEVELTQILSEQIALELDREVLNDLLSQANGANLYWSRAPGKFVNKLTGVEVPRNSSLRPGPQFTGTVRDWYETLVETIIDAANVIHRKTLRGSANFVVIGPDVATIFEASVMYKPSYSIDGEGQASAISIGAEKIGNLSNRFTVYKDPYFPRNKILIGYKGGSYLETGYVYAPYVPLIVTPTIFAPEDFTPRKGVMTRYGKKMVRSDFYGTVTCMDMNII